MDTKARPEFWRVVTPRCANGYRQETKSMRKSVYRKQLDLGARPDSVWTA
jgi:hypothetical protein